MDVEGKDLNIEVLLSVFALRLKVIVGAESVFAVPNLWILLLLVINTVS